MASPSATKLFEDIVIDPLDPPPDDIAMQVYNGVVRRYDYDSEKIKIMRNQFRLNIIATLKYLKIL